MTRRQFFARLALAVPAASVLAAILGKHRHSNSPSVREASGQGVAAREAAGEIEFTHVEPNAAGWAGYIADGRLYVLRERITLQDMRERIRRDGYARVDRA